MCACAANACESMLRRKMSNPFQYHPELGMYYHEVAPGLLCGTQLRTPADVERLAGTPPLVFVVAFLGWLGCYSLLLFLTDRLTGPSKH